MNAKAKPKLTIEAVVIHKDGTRKDLGVIAETKDLNIVQKFLRSVRGNG